VARIRTIKPEFFRDEGLQDLEAGNSGCHVMLVYAGLWGHCDKNGVFEYRPRQLKLDILPFLPFSMDQALELLTGAGFIIRFVVDGKDFGYIPKFSEHQRINGKEALEPGKYPLPGDGETSGNKQGSNGEALGKQLGSTGDHPEKQEGKGREVLKPLASDDSANRPSPKVGWCETGFTIPQPVEAGFKSAYPAVDLKTEIARAHAWVLANPKNRKSNWGRFLNGWLQRCQDRAPVVRPIASADPMRGVL